MNSATLHSHLQGKDNYYSHFVEKETQAQRSNLSKVQCPVMSLGVKLSLTAYLTQAQRSWSLGAGQPNPENAGKRVASVLSAPPLNLRQIIGPLTLGTTGSQSGTSPSSPTVCCPVRAEPMLSTFLLRQEVPLHFLTQISWGRHLSELPGC